MTKQLSKTGKRIVGDKSPFLSSKVLYEMDVYQKDHDPSAPLSHNGAEILNEIARLHPNARVVHVIRDGRDVAISLMHFMWSRAKNEGMIYPLAPEELRKREAYRRDPSSLKEEGLLTERRLTAIARGWNAEVEKAINDGPAILGERYTEVRYEDLLQRPEKEVRRLLGFLGADTSEEMIKECAEAADFERLSQRKQGHEDSTSVRFRKGIMGDWQNYFTERDKHVFKEEAGELLVRLGYEKDLSW
jgi:microcompartment protein CcmL/EutN